jgi:hypothetical protein
MGKGEQKQYVFFSLSPFSPFLLLCNALNWEKIVIA